MIYRYDTIYDTDILKIYTSLVRILRLQTT